MLRIIVAFGIGFFLLILWGRRYLDWGIPIGNVVNFVIFALVAYLFVLRAFRKNNPLTPYSVYAVFIFLSGFSFIPLNATNESLTTYAFILLFLSILFFLLGLHIGGRCHITYRPLRFSSRIRLLCFRSCFILACFVFLLECRMLGYIPITSMLVTDVYADMGDTGIPILHYFVQLANIFPIWALLLYRNSLIRKRERNLVVILSLFIAFNSLSRQMWLLMILAFMFYYLYYYYVSKVRLVAILLIPIVMFVLIGSIRLYTIGSRGDRTELEYLKDYANTQYDVNLLEVYLGLYSTNNFTTFKDFVSSSDENGYRGMGAYTFQAFYTITLLNMLAPFQMSIDYNSFASLGTYAIEPYLDFGLLGVIFINFFYGCITSYSYKKYESKDYRWILPCTLFIFCSLMGAFTNYFNVFFIWFVFVANFIILPPYPSCKSVVDKRFNNNSL
ncbi:oligosaccharide repeat unit polymerase [Bacteroidales bacterium SW292]|nr:oligosaccharide repeat unit polymerase [Bacteroidales bacterium SW292]